MKKTCIFLLLISTTFAIYSQEEEINEEYFEISKNLTVLSEVYKNVNLHFVDEVNPGELMKKGIDAMLKSLDPYTNYIAESNIEDYRMAQSGQYGGIGSLIGKEGEYIKITNPYENFPAQKAGLKAGDIIYEIDGKSIKGKNSREVSNLLKGTKGTQVVLKVKRKKEDKLIEISITRELIKIPTVPFYDMLNEDIGYIKLTQFMATSSSEITQAFNELKDSNGMKSLILDLRGNPGGLLREAVNIVNMFVPQGTKVVESKGRFKKTIRTDYTKNKPLDLKMPVIVLIDKNSASASEIVSGSLQDLDRAVIIGNQSYGKGLVQQTKEMEYNSIIKITIAKYYTPSGRCIQRLDYSDRNSSGKGSVISDSLLQTFKTKNGRPVMDGRGINPDIEVKQNKYSRLSATLIIEDIIFDFATDYYYNNSSIKSASKFELTEEEYQSFIQYALQKEFKYESGSEKLLERLEKLVKEEKNFETSKAEFEALKKKLSPNKERDLMKFKKEIKLLLENEIVSRYYFQKGQAIHDLKSDDYILKSIEILSNKTKYTKILKP